MRAACRRFPPPSIRSRKARTSPIGDHAWRVIVGHGHAPEHASLYCDELRRADLRRHAAAAHLDQHRVFAGAPDANPLAWFLASLDRLRELPEDTLVLPSHGLPFRGLHARVAQLAGAPRRPLRRPARGLRRRRRSAAELIPVLFPREITDPHQTMFAMGEAIAHLNYLQQARRLERVDENGTIRYART